MALRQGSLPVEEIAVAAGVKGAWVTEVRQLARQRQVRFRVLERTRLDALAGTTHHQGVAARVEPIAMSRPRPSWTAWRPARPHPWCGVADGLTDPMNLGNLIRSAHAAGALAIFLPKDRAAA